MSDEKLNGAAEPTAAPEAAPKSYEADLDSDIRSAWEEVESKGGGEKDDTGAESPSAGRVRDERGRFAKADGEQPSEAPEQQAARAAQQAEQQAAPEQAEAAPTGPPSSWSVAAKAAWDELPDQVRAAIAKRETEMAAGQAEYAANAGDFRELKPYAEMARASGTTLSAALQRYTTMEGSLRANPAQGLMDIAQNMGLSQAQAAHVFAELGARLGARAPSGYPSNGGQQPSHGGQGQADPLMEVIGPLIERSLGPVASKLGALESHVTQQQQAHQQAVQRSVSEAIEKFAADPAHRYFNDLEPTISRLFETGMVERTADPAADLAKAYEMAAYNHPEVREALFNQRTQATAAGAKAKDKEAAARAAAASRSITGSTADTPAVRSGKRRAGMSYDDDLMADIRAAADEVAGR